MQISILLLADETMNMYMPHGYCYLWNWPLVWLHLVSDSLVGLAYTSIPFTLVYFVRKRRDLPFQSMFWWFGTFIVACGATHYMEIWNLWHADYWLAGFVKAVTAVASVATAGLLVGLVPEALALPSPRQMEVTNIRLAKEIAEHEQALEEIKLLNEGLETRVRERTAQLEATMQGMQKEIDERRRVEEALRRWEATFAHAGWGIVLVNPETHILAAVNPAFATMHGYTVEELVGSSIMETFAPEWKEKAEQLGLLAQEKGHQVFEAVHVRKDGSRFPVLTDMTVFKNRDGKVLYRACNYQDITERKQAQSALQETNDRLTDVLHRTEQRSQEIAFVKEMSNLLQICTGTEEAYQIVRDFAQRLFPFDSGALCLMNPSLTLMDAVAVWGQPGLREPVFAPEQCWALRTAKVHMSGALGTSLPCPHLAESFLGQYVCVPMVAQNESIGLLHVQSPCEELDLPDGARRHRQQERQRLAMDFAADIALAIANLRLRESLRTQSIRDPLTGLFNRRYLSESLEREVQRSERTKRPLSIIMLDLDRFKPFNDEHGHEAGDALLRSFGRFLLKRTRGADVACRYGGDEFIILLVEADLEIARKRAEELREGFRRITVGHGKYKLEAISLSMGVVVCPDHGETVEDLLAAADQALYQAKKKGRNQVMVYKKSG